MARRPARSRVQPPKTCDCPPPNDRDHPACRADVTQRDSTAHHSESADPSWPPFSEVVNQSRLASALPKRRMSTGPSLVSVHKRLFLLASLAALLPKEGGLRRRFNPTGDCKG